MKLMDSDLGQRSPRGHGNGHGNTAADGNGNGNGHTGNAKGDPPIVFKSKVVVMQRIQDLVRREYGHWTSGIIPAAKISRFVRKFDSKYGTSANRAERQRRKRYGVRTGWLIIWQPEAHGLAMWWLLVDEKHIANHVEMTRFAGDKDARIKIPAAEVIGSRDGISDYELVRLDGRWTWRMTKERYEAWRARIRQAVLEPDSDRRAMLCRQAGYSLHKAPGFRGIRSNVYELIRYCRSRWQRARGGKSSPPVKLQLPSKVRRLRHG